MLRTLLIDDEPLAREELRRLLGAHPEVAIVGEAEDVPGAQIRLAVADYDLVLLDIQLAGGSGFDLVPHVTATARIIFVTAHDRFAVRAFEVNALDYLLKPVSTTRLASALGRVQAASTASTAASAAAAPAVALPASAPSAAALAADDLVSVKTGPGAMRFVRVADIVVLTSQDNYSEVRLASGEHFLVRQTLSAWEERLPATHFLRVHRQTIVSLPRIEGFVHEDEEATSLRVTALREPVRARRSRWPELSARLAALGKKI